MFPNSERAGAYLDNHQLSDRQLILVIESELLFFVADLHARGVNVVCCDPEPDGSGGTNVDLADFMGQLERDG